MKRFYLFFVLILCLAGVQAQKFVQYSALYDLQGRLVYSQNSSNSPTLSLKSVPAGVYLLRVTDTDGREYHQKIVKK